MNAKTNDRLLELLKEAKALAMEQQAETKVAHIEVNFIMAAIDMVGRRSAYLKKTAQEKPEVTRRRGDAETESAETATTAEYTDHAESKL